jgi:hypothetical protein
MHDMMESSVGSLCITANPPISELYTGCPLFYAVSDDESEPSTSRHTCDSCLCPELIITRARYFLQLETKI